jgi:hypothetical protein
MAAGCEHIIDEDDFVDAGRQPSGSQAPQA